MSTHELLEAVRALPTADRWRLVEALLALDDDQADGDPAELEAAWSEEIARRVAEVRSGKAELVDAREVLAEARRLVDQKR